MVALEQIVDVPVKRAAKEPPGLFHTPGTFPGIEELKAEARQKTAERFAYPSGDSLQKYCGVLKDIFTEDGLEYQRRLRDEWPD
jgi:hypothetical protein